jgi:hypothetical protein
MAESPKQFPRTVWLGMSLAFGLLGLAYIISLTEMEPPGKSCCLSSARLTISH